MLALCNSKLYCELSSFIVLQKLKELRDKKMGNFLLESHQLQKTEHILWYNDFVINL